MVVVGWSFVLKSVLHFGLLFESLPIVPIVRSCVDHMERLTATLPRSEIVARKHG
jgi:hypothetical protein